MSILEQLKSNELKHFVKTFIKVKDDWEKF